MSAIKTKKNEAESTYDIELKGLTKAEVYFLIASMNPAYTTMETVDGFKKYIKHFSYEDTAVFSFKLWEELCDLVGVEFYQE